MRMFHRNFVAAIAHIESRGSLRVMRFSTARMLNSGGHAKHGEVDTGVIFQQVGDFGVITMNRPKALNALNLTMIRALRPQLSKWKLDPNVHAVIIKSKSDKAFCAGGDVVAMAKELRDPPARGERVSDRFFFEEYQVNHAIGTFGKPYVALIDGVCMGGGVGMSLHGSFRVVTERALCAMPEMTIGLFPDVGTSRWLHSLPRKLGAFLALSGHRLFGADLKHAQFATHFGSSRSLAQLETELLAIRAPRAADIEHVLDLFERRSSENFAESGRQDAGRFSLEPHLDTIEECFSAASVEQLLERLAQRAPSNAFCAEVQAALARSSPTSLKIALRLVEYEASKFVTLRDVFTTDYRLTQHICADGDFAEGVRALLIDKDKKPHWRYSLAEVTDRKLDWYFSRLSADREWHP